MIQNMNYILIEIKNKKDGKIVLKSETLEMVVIQSGILWSM